jgi:hypothetical protein
MSARKLWLIVPWALFALIAAAWIIYWNVVANTAEARVRAWAAEQAQHGGRASIERVVRRGFPVLLRLELHGLAYAPARGGWSAATERADLHVQVLNPQHVILQAEAPIGVSRADGAVTNITADALIASLRTEGRALAVAGVEADNLALDDPAQEGVLRARKVVLNVRPDARAAGDYQAAFDAQEILLPRPVRSFEAFGLEIPMLRAALVVTDGAALLQASEHDPLGPWLDAGGRVRIEGLELHWGPLETLGRGEGGLDEQRRLEGSLTLPIEHPAPIFTAIANGPNVNEDARRALGLLAAGYMISGDDITLDVDARDGVLRLEGLPVRPLPAVY